MYLIHNFLSILKPLSAHRLLHPRIQKKVRQCEIGAVGRMRNDLNPPTKQEIGYGLRFMRPRIVHMQFPLSFSIIWMFSKNVDVHKLFQHLPVCVLRDVDLLGHLLDIDDTILIEKCDDQHFHQRPLTFLFLWQITFSFHPTAAPLFSQWVVHIGPRFVSCHHIIKPRRVLGNFFPIQLRHANSFNFLFWCKDFRNPFRTHTWIAKFFLYYRLSRGRMKSVGCLLTHVMSSTGLPLTMQRTCLLKLRLSPNRQCQVLLSILRCLTLSQKDHTIGISLLVI